jgi:hypothetical protein
VESPCLPQMLTKVRMRPASAPPTSANGTRSSSPLIRRCCLRLSLLPTTLILSSCCKCLNPWPCYLLVHGLKLLCSDVGCKTVANMIKGKTPEEIRKLFNIVNDFTPEEEVITPHAFNHVHSLISRPNLGPDQERKRKSCCWIPSYASD